MDFYTVFDQVLDLLRQRGRVSYRALKLQFHLDDEHLEALKEELIEVQQLATDQDGRMLVWAGAAPATSEPVPPALRPTPPSLTSRQRGASRVTLLQPHCIPLRRNAVSSLLCFATWSTRRSSRASSTPKTYGR